MEVRKSGRTVPATPDAKRGVTWIGPVPKSAVVDASAGEGYRTFGGREYLVFRHAGSSTWRRCRDAACGRTHAGRAGSVRRSRDGCARLLRGCAAPGPAPELPGVRLAEIERQISAGSVAEALQGLDYLRREKAADLPIGDLERLAASALAALGEAFGRSVTGAAWNDALRLARSAAAWGGPTSPPAGPRSRSSASSRSRTRRGEKRFTGLLVRLAPSTPAGNRPPRSWRRPSRPPIRAGNRRSPGR